MRLAIIKPLIKNLEQPHKSEVKRSIEGLRIRAVFEYIDAGTGQKSTMTHLSGTVRQKTNKRPTISPDIEPADNKRTCTSPSASEAFENGVSCPGGSINSSLLNIGSGNNAIWRLSPPRAQLLDPVENMSLPDIEHLLDGPALDDLFQSPAQGTNPSAADSQVSQSSEYPGRIEPERAVVRSSQSKRTQDTLPRELHIYSLAEVIANQNIIDFNMERILNKIRVSGILELWSINMREKILFSSGFENIFETCGWPNDRFQPRSSPIERLVLHPIPSPRHWRANLKAWVSRVRSGTLMTHLPAEATDREVEAEVVNCRISETLHSLMWDARLYMNYLLIVGGAHGPIVWRIW